MNTTRIQSNTSDRVWFTLVDSDNVAVTGLTGVQLDMLTITRLSDGKYYNGVDNWEASKTDLTVTEKDATNSPGLYFYDTPLLAEDTYYVRVDTSDAENDPLETEIIAGDYVDNIIDINTVTYEQVAAGNPPTSPTIIEMLMYSYMSLMFENIATDNLITIKDSDGNDIVVATILGSGPGEFIKLKFRSST